MFPPIFFFFYKPELSHGKLCLKLPVLCMLAILGDVNIMLPEEAHIILKYVMELNP